MGVVICRIDFKANGIVKAWTERKRIVLCLQLSGVIKTNIVQARRVAWTDTDFDGVFFVGII